ncbi:MAG: polysaccharide biosynthesis tyrosine autokinase [Blastocatellia bacterium]
MSKVYEALLRQQQVEQNGDTTRDPLAENTGSPDEALIETEENGLPHFELPSVIGSPIGPRSNEGALFSTVNAHSLTEPAIENTAAPQPPVTRPVPTSPTNGNAKPTAERRQSPRPALSPSPATINSRALAEKLKNSPPVIRRAEPEISNPKREISNKELNPLVLDSELASTESNIQHPASNIPKRQHEVPVERIQPTKLHPRLVLLTNPQAPECEQYRSLRTQLFHAAEKRKAQVVIITSTLAGEGKTSTTINLGLAIAQSEKRVLVIDGDLRRPAVAEYLGTRAKAGFGEALRGEADPLDLLFTIEGHELYLLAVSRESSNPTELLSSERWAGMIGELRRHFDFILIDSPPVLPFADARLLANHSDAVILVVRAGMAQYETVEKAIEALPAGKMLGVTLNDAELTEEAGYYDYYYNYAQRNQSSAWWKKLLRPIRNTNLGRKLKL